MLDRTNLEKVNATINVMFFIFGVCTQEGVGSLSAMGQHHLLDMALRKCSNNWRQETVAKLNIRSQLRRMTNCGGWSYALALIGTFVIAYGFWSYATPPISYSVEILDSELQADLCLQRMAITVKNCDKRTIRVIGFIPYCCNGKFGFGVTEVDIPEFLPSGNSFRIEATASFSKIGDDWLERVAGVVLIDDAKSLNREEIIVGFSRHNAIKAAAQNPTL